MVPSAMTRSRVHKVDVDLEMASLARLGSDWREVSPMLQVRIGEYWIPHADYYHVRSYMSNSLKFYMDIERALRSTVTKDWASSPT